MENKIRIETIIGFNGNEKSLLRWVPGGTTAVVMAVGGLVVMEEPQSRKQMSVKAHTSPISALTVSPSATGQCMGYCGKVMKAPIKLISSKNLAIKGELSEMTGDVMQIEFSPDGKFMAAIDSSGKLNVWETASFKTVTSRVFDQKSTRFTWGGVASDKKFPDYTIVTTNNTNVDLHTLTYSLSSMSYVAKFQHVQLPNTGFNRQYECNLVDTQSNFYYAGTRGGELSVFDLNSKLFKASVQAGKSYLKSIALDSAKGLMYCGFSNGQIKILSGSKDKWVIKQEAQLEGMPSLLGEVTSLEIDFAGGQVLIGTAASCVYMCPLGQLKPAIYLQAHCSAIVGVDSSNGVLVSIDKGAFVKLWSGKNPRGPTIQVPPNPLQKSEGTCVAFGDYPYSLQGYSSGDITCLNSETAKQEWSMLKSHKGPVTSLLMNKTYIVSGGKDCVIRIWGRTNHNMLTQLELHTSPIVRVMQDFNDASIIHTASVDKEMVSYDLRKEKKIVQHRVSNGTLGDISQKKTAEFEIISCGTNNPISFWDVDRPKPVAELPLQDKLSCLAISPNGRLVAIGSENNQIYLLDPVAKRLIAQAEGHSDYITKIAWLNDRSFVSSSSDSTLIFWTV